MAYHAGSLAVNLGRNALALALTATACREAYVPCYVCDAVLEPLVRLGIKPRFYFLDENLEPLLDTVPMADAAFLYVNYFGLKGACARRLAQAFASPVLIDNTQAFFERHIPGAMSFNSARKFFGVPDGAYLYSGKVAVSELERDCSYDRCEHLLRSADCGTEAGYGAFCANEKALSSMPPRRMSQLTSRLLSTIDYGMVAARRRQNYLRLDAALGGFNQLRLPLLESAVPLCYPFLVDNGVAMKAELIDRRIFVPTFWPGVSGRAPAGTMEARLADDLVCLPIDQRYSVEDMDLIASAVQSCYGGWETVGVLSTT